MLAAVPGAQDRLVAVTRTGSTVAATKREVKDALTAWICSYSYATSAVSIRGSTVVTLVFSRKFSCTWKAEKRALSNAEVEIGQKHFLSFMMSTVEP